MLAFNVTEDSFQLDTSRLDGFNKELGSVLARLVWNGLTLVKMIGVEMKSMVFIELKEEGEKQMCVYEHIQVKTTTGGNISKGQTTERNERKREREKKKERKWTEQKES